MMHNNSEHDKEGNIDVEDSPLMNQDEMELFLNVRRSKSDESMIDKLFNHPMEPQKSRVLIINYPAAADDPNKAPPPNFKLFRKIKKEKKKNESDYCKNICGYITKKIIRELCSPNYSSHVKGLCHKHECDYQELKTFYLPKIELVTGPSHIPNLLVPETKEEEKKKLVFKEFFEWFIKFRYLRYLLIEGKMADKKAYIKYKNYMLLAMLNDGADGKDQVVKAEMGSSQDSDSSSSHDQENDERSEPNKGPKPANLQAKVENPANNK